MNWTRVRLTIYAVLGCGLVIGLVEQAGNAGFDMAVAIFSVLAGLVVVFDVVYFSAIGKSQPCTSCGHPMKHRSLRMSSACPNCAGKARVDISNLRGPSETVRKICDDPQSSSIAAVKAYCDETGTGLSEGKAVIDAYLAQRSKY